MNEKEVRKEIIARAIKNAQDVNNSLDAMKPREPDLPGGGFYLIIGKGCDISLPAEIVKPFFDGLIEMNKELIDKFLDKYEKEDD